jgi:hypothetical protein
MEITRPFDRNDRSDGTARVNLSANGNWSDRFSGA